MIERLLIEDFQAHHKLAIDLDPAVTTIVGPSDAGKSAVIRALIWLATNRPLGDTFIRDGVKQARVTLHVDGHEIVRTRGKSINTYSIDGEELKAFGNDVPEGIANFLNLSNINLQHQHDAPFWFSKTAGEVSRQLNQIVDLSIIDHTLGNLEQVHRATTAEVLSLEQQEEQAKEERSALSWVRKAQGDLDKLEEREEQWEAAQDTHRDATERVQAVRLHKETVVQLKSGQEAAEQVLEIGARWDDSRDKALLMEETIEEIKVSREEIQRAEAAANVLLIGSQWEGIREKVSLLRELAQEVREHTAQQKQPIPDLDGLEQLREIAVEVSQRRVLLQETITTARAAQRRVQDIGTEAQEAEDKFHEQMGDVCPLCTQKL